MAESNITHHYKCNKCERLYVVFHFDDTLYVDECPECGYEGNTPECIEEIISTEEGGDGLIE